MSKPFHYEVSPMKEADFTEISRIYTLAFFDNPTYNSIFPLFSDEDKFRAFVWFFKKRLWIAHRLGWVMMKVVDVTNNNNNNNNNNTSNNDSSNSNSCSSGRIVGACCAVPPGGDSSLWDNIQAGILAWPYLWGLPSLLALFHAMKENIHFAGWELAMMAVVPEYQSKGAGTALLRGVLGEVRERSRGRADYLAVIKEEREGEGEGKGGGGEAKLYIHLSTQREQNVEFYRKAGGFRLIGREVRTHYIDERMTYPSWYMRLEL